MKKYRTEKEVKDLLKTMALIVDTREQVNYNILGYLSEKGIPHISRKLDVGDYSCEIDGMTLEDSIAIERKNSIDEIAGNFTADRKRFENEFLRAKANGTKMFLVIENCSWQDIKSHNYHSKMSPAALMGSLLSWQTKYNITVIFTIPELTGEIITHTLYYWARESLI